VVDWFESEMHHADFHLRVSGMVHCVYVVGAVSRIVRVPWREVGTLTWSETCETGRVTLGIVPANCLVVADYSTTEAT